jgi:para-nitrobenzyl esterase
MVTDQLMGWGARLWVVAQARTGHAPAYIYLLNEVPPVPEEQTLFAMSRSRLGATHGAESYFVFNQLPALQWKWTPADIAVARAVQGYFVNFAKTGNPNGPSLPRWTPVSAATALPQLMVFGNPVQMARMPHAEGMRIVAEASAGGSASR